MIDPKKEFLKTDDAKLLAELVASRWFQHACSIALVQMQMEMGNAENPAKGWDNYSKLLGARRFISTLIDLPDPAIRERKKLSGTLDYDT